MSGRVYLINSNTDDEIAKRGLKLYLNPVTSYLNSGMKRVI